MQQVCLIATEIGQFASAAVGLLDENGHLVLVNAGNGSLAGTVQRYSGSDFRRFPLSETPTGKVLATGKSSFNNDVQHDPHLNFLQDEMKRTGIRSAASFPIKKFGVVIGVFSFLSTQEQHFDEKELALLDEAAGDISFALEVFDKERERQLGKEQLERSQANLQAIIENTDATIYSLDREFRYIAFNHLLYESVRQTYGIEIKVGDKVFAFLEIPEPEEAKGWDSIYTQALNGETVKFEREFVRNDMTSCLSFSIHPIWENKKVIGLSCFVYDITKQKEDERHKARMTSDLLARNADLEQFSYIVSHNLRAPVANILGIADLIKNNYMRKGDEPVVREHLFQAVDKLDVVIKDLNLILQIKREVNELREPVVLAELVDNIQSSIQNLIEKQQAKIVTDFTEAGTVVTIKSYLQSIFYNLISNAIKYARPDQRPFIRITSEKTGDSIILRFVDNGRGVDLEQHGENIFRLYKRFHLDVEGKGVGLYG